MVLTLERFQSGEQAEIDREALVTVFTAHAAEFDEIGWATLRTTDEGEAEIAGRVFADLGAEVLHVELPAGDPLRAALPFAGPRRDPDASLRFSAWNAGKRGLACEAGDPRLDVALAGADIVIDTPGWPGVHQLDPARAVRDTVAARATERGERASFTRRSMEK